MGVGGAGKLANEMQHDKSKTALNSSSVAIYLFFKGRGRNTTKNPPVTGGFAKVLSWPREQPVDLHELPRALLVPVRLQTLAALVLRHLQTTFLFEITHV